MPKKYKNSPDEYNSNKKEVPDMKISATTQISPAPYI